MTDCFFIDPVEMERRRDEDFRAMLDMIGEGSPVFELYGEFDIGGSICTRKKGETFPETYR